MLDFIKDTELPIDEQIKEWKVSEQGDYPECMPVVRYMAGSTGIEKFYSKLTAETDWS